MKVFASDEEGANGDEEPSEQADCVTTVKLKQGTTDEGCDDLGEGLLGLGETKGATNGLFADGFGEETVEGYVGDAGGDGDGDDDEDVTEDGGGEAPSDEPDGEDEGAVEDELGFFEFFGDFADDETLGDDGHDTD